MLASVRRVRYAVASSLDGYIAGPDGEVDWIIHDPDIDFGQLFKQFDTLLVGSRTFEAMVHGGQATMPGMETFVFSNSLRQADHQGVNIVAGNAAECISSLRQRPGKDLWLFGGGTLFRSFLNEGLVNTVEVSIIPVLLGAGIPLLPSNADRAKLKLTSHRVYKSGIVSLEYSLA
jgi:dihydrofolate reductase